MKSSPIFAAGALLLTACLFWPDDDKRENPFIGQWKSSHEVVETFRDSLHFDQLRGLLDGRGYDPFGNWPPPQELLDSFNAAYSCTDSICDSVLWVQKEYLVFTGDTGTHITWRNGVLRGVYAWAYRFDKDSLYQTDSIPYLETRTNSWPYAFSGDRDTVTIGYESDARDNVWVRNEDALPSY